MNKKTEKLKILIVSNSPQKRDYYRSLFHDMGFFVEACWTYEGAIGVCYLNLKTYTPIHGCIIDYDIDIRNGIDLAKELKNIDPKITLMLFPSSLLEQEKIKEEYITFGGFDCFPDDSQEGIEGFINKIIENKANA